MRAHIALCVIAAVRDPDIDDQVMTPRTALAALANIQLHGLDAGRRIELVDRPTPLQRKMLDALSVDTSTWNRAAFV